MHEQIDIFAEAEGASQERVESSGDLPIDFIVVPHFITRAEEHGLFRLIDAAPWDVKMKRRVQQYGFRYDYRARAVGSEDRLGDLPDWTAPLAARLVDYEYFATLPDQVIVNEYQPGQGISSHTDRESCFGPVVASLSLGSDIVMDFSQEHGEKGSLLLPRCSLLVLKGASRSSWQHGIAQRRRDSINASSFERKRRISLTFRSVVFSQA